MHLDALIELYLQPGQSISSVSRVTGYSRAKLKKLLAAAGIEIKSMSKTQIEMNNARNGRSPKYIEPPSDIADLIELYNTNGQTLSSIEKISGHSRHSLKNWFKEAGVELKSHTRASVEANNRKSAGLPERENFIVDYNAMTIDQLKRKYRVSSNKLKEWIKFFDIEKIGGAAISFGKTKAFMNKLPQIDNIQSEYEKSGFNKSILMDNFNLTRHQLKKLFDINNIETINPCRSKAEINLFNVINIMDPDGKWINSEKTVIAPLELDMYSPVHNIAIEYCGLYWHSQLSGRKYHDYHANKMKLCSAKNIRLITVFESDPIDKIYSLISMLTGKSVRVAGRDTVVERSIREAVVAHEDQNHISGSAPAKLYYCLKHKKTGEILSTMSFGIPRFSKSYQWEIIRYTVRNGYTVVGGASKLFAKFVEENNPSSVMTYADLRFGTGEIYKRLGFQLDHVSGPNYWYFKKNSLKLNHRAGFQKHKLKDRLEVFDTRLTEFENMVANGYDRIWDCGNAIYSWSK